MALACPFSPGTLVTAPLAAPTVYVSGRPPDQAENVGFAFRDPSRPTTWSWLTACSRITVSLACKASSAARSAFRAVMVGAVGEGSSRGAV
ncbi:hypothetical protein D3C72_1931160 [compost metagenome]